MSVRPTFQNLAKQNNFQVRIVIATSGIVGLAVWIIDGTCLVLLFISFLHHFLLLLQLSSFPSSFSSEKLYRATKNDKITKQTFDSPSNTEKGKLIYLAFHWCFSFSTPFSIFLARLIFFRELQRHTFIACYKWFGHVMNSSAFSSLLLNKKS